MDRHEHYETLYRVTELLSKVFDDMPGSQIERAQEWDKKELDSKVTEFVEGFCKRGVSERMVSPPIVGAVLLCNMCLEVAKLVPPDALAAIIKDVALDSDSVLSRFYEHNGFPSVRDELLRMLNPDHKAETEDKKDISAIESVSIIYLGCRCRLR